MALDKTVLPRYAEGQFRGVVTAGELLDLSTGEKVKISDLATGGGGPVTSATITDATTVGKAVLTAADAGAARQAIGAGTSNLAIGPGATDALAGNTVIPPAYTLPNASATVRGGVLQAATQANSAATDVAGLLADFNALLAKLKTAGVVASA